MSAESALHNTDQDIEQTRMANYRSLGLALTYPDDTFFEAFPAEREQKDSLQEEYDSLFRAGIVWLYGAEHLADNEFQRAEMLADIMGFYKAFAVEPEKERPDAFSCEMGFMHYIIFKRLRVEKIDKEKTSICRDAEEKFFKKHFLPASLKMSEKLSSCVQQPFYRQVADDLQKFLVSEQNYFGVSGQQTCSENVEEKNND